MPKAISHESRLVDAEAAVEKFADEIRALGDTLGAILLQLPPSLAYGRSVADSFCALLRRHIAHPVVCEPRHPSWFMPDADSLFGAYAIARAAANPASVPLAGVPGGARGLSYYRLHGSPRMYYSPYEPDFLSGLAAAIRTSAADEVWCIYDNTASGAATANALATQAILNQSE